MEFTRHRIEWKGNLLSYVKFGTGPVDLLAFHGFGQSAEEFSGYLKNLGEHYTIYAFDHFFHGNSHWNTDLPIFPSDFKTLINLFLKKEGVEKFEIIAYSLGGKWAYTCVRRFPDRILKMTLCAPDGSKTNFYYSFSSRNRLGRYLFQKSVKYPGFYFGLLRNALKLGVIPKSIYRFAYFQMGTEEKRNQVANTWIKYRKFKGLSNTTINILNERNIPVFYILGAYDSVIRPEWFDRVRSMIKPQNLKITILKKGHRTILTSIAPLMLQEG